jgi:hypothetical protein
MDNYLDILDGNIRDITEYLADSLSGSALAGLESSQQAFIEYRRQNCFWYLEFSSPRSDAEQIAKNCLATMSRQRLEELQALVTAEDTSGQAARGYYIYGAERNTFEPCGTDKRYWLEGDLELVGRAQQQYLSIATSNLQVLYAVLVGTVDEQAQAPQGHQGVFQLERLIELRVPTESDCRLTGDAAVSAQVAATPAASVSTVGDMPVDDQPASLDGPEEQLIGYFGAWLVDCTDAQNIRACRLQVELNADAQAPAVSLSIIRQKQQSSALEVFFAEREIDDPARIRWQVDGMVFGDIVQSEIRVDESGTRQLIPASRYLREEMLPMMIRGVDLNLQVLASVDDDSGERYVGTLKGLTKAMAFADDFIRDGGS